MKTQILDICFIHLILDGMNLILDGMNLILAGMNLMLDDMNLIHFYNTCYILTVLDTFLQYLILFYNT